MLTVHHLGISQSERIVWLCEELELDYQLKLYERRADNRLAPDAYKAMILAGTSADVIYTNAVNGLPASWLKASIRSIGLDPDNLPKVSGRGTDHLPAGIKPWRDVWSAGQGIGLIHDLPTVAELVRRLQTEYVAACAQPDLSKAAAAALHNTRP